MVLYYDIRYHTMYASRILLCMWSFGALPELTFVVLLLCGPWPLNLGLYSLDGFFIRRRSSYCTMRGWSFMSLVTAFSSTNNAKDKIGPLKPISGI